MSLHDYQTSKLIAEADPSFAALIMAALRKADTYNARLLREAWPDICAEMQARYDAPGGMLDDKHGERYGGHLTPEHVRGDIPW